MSKTDLQAARDELTFISRDEIATFLAVTAQRVSSMVRDGILPQDSEGRFVRQDAIFAICEWYRARLGEGKSSFSAAKMEARQMENELLKLQVERARGEVIAVETAKKVMGNVIMTSRQKFLGLANKLAPRMPFLKSEQEIENAIAQEIEEALTALSRPVEYAEEEIAKSESE